MLIKLSIMTYFSTITWQILRRKLEFQHISIILPFSVQLNLCPNISISNKLFFQTIQDKTVYKGTQGNLKMSPLWPVPEVNIICTFINKKMRLPFGSGLTVSFYTTKFHFNIHTFFWIYIFLFWTSSAMNSHAVLDHFFISPDDTMSARWQKKAWHICFKNGFCKGRNSDGLTWAV